MTCNSICRRTHGAGGVAAAILWGFGTLSVAEGPGGQRPDTRLHLGLEAPSEVLLGDPLELRIRYSNAGSAPFILDRGLGVGPTTDLRVFAVGNGCEVEAPDMFIEEEAVERPFFKIPLVSGRVLEERLLLNDIHGRNTKLPIRSAGDYQLFVEFVSAGQDAPGSMLWSGTIRSSPLRLTVGPPREETLALWRGALNRCLGGDCRQLLPATKFFSLVRDPEAADYLARLLGMGLRDSGVPFAVAAQGRKIDVPALRSHARAQVAPVTREYYLEAAARIERGDPCM